MTRMKRLCVFCGSNPGKRPEYEQAAEELGALLAAAGINLVYGGGSVGLMGRTASKVIEAGGEATGVIPAYINRKISALPGVRLIETATMHERKQKMYDLSDAFLALPGGIGTLEELAEVYTWSQLGYHRKPVGLLNTAGFYDHFLAFLDSMTTEGFLNETHRKSLVSATKPRKIISLLESVEYIESEKWTER